MNHRQEIESFLPVEKDWFFDIHPFPLKETFHIVFDEKRNRILITEAITLGILKITEEHSTNTFDTFAPEIKEKILTLSEKRVERYIQALKENLQWQRLLYIQQDLELLPINLRDILATYYLLRWNLDEDLFVKFYLEEYERLLSEQLTNTYPTDTLGK